MRPLSSQLRQVMDVDYPTKFEVIVIGGGHAGTEAALAAARMGSKTLLLSHNIETLGQMSCNPAIGGIGKSHLVMEVDALGGAMAQATDRAGIQFRTLNARKGPAVRATRVQADRVLYKGTIRHILENQENLFLFQQAADDLILEGERVAGVISNTGIRFYAPSVVLTAGTFLGGRIHIGMDSHSGGRAGDPPSLTLADRLRELPLRVERLKTGTPPRIDARSVDFSNLQQQWGDDPRPVMSYIGDASQHPAQRCCWITHTNPATHDIIRGSLDRSPMFAGVIEGVGPRYCPSIEDKIHRFADKSSHQVFIEPEGLTTHELYPNGISTSLPFDVQVQLVRSIAGFEQAHITRPGYAIEYDFFDPRDLQYSLETRLIDGLFFAGQINGTTGYEEAAAQGLLAGLNAALKVKGREPWCPRRDEAYLGVLIDDLITMGTAEPYRMFTSRAEYRLSLRQDNADLRLTEKGRQLGLVDDDRWRLFSKKRQSIEANTALLQSTRVSPGDAEARRMDAWLDAPLARDCTLMDLLKRPGVSFDHCLPSSDVDPRVAEQVEIAAKYSGYIERQKAEIEQARQYESARVPDNFDYHSVSGLSNEVRQKLTDARPESLARAARIPGVTPAAISLLLVTLKKRGMLERQSA